MDRCAYSDHTLSFSSGWNVQRDAPRGHEVIGTVSPLRLTCDLFPLQLSSTVRGDSIAYAATSVYSMSVLRHPKIRLSGADVPVALQPVPCPGDEPREDRAAANIREDVCGRTEGRIKAHDPGFRITQKQYPPCWSSWTPENERIWRVRAASPCQALRLALVTKDAWASRLREKRRTST